ncbi:hypothetical protein [Pseudanabaena sp. PCC 6802]|uniref:hypothetical protein n=1 Tax=Pseudanabaena sp. PCC 6802 TaxID=118173 RepID=UPI00034512DE|nr:hypothetical protein [Pseudanabaena sp. PCC 6802]
MPLSNPITVINVTQEINNYTTNEYITQEVKGNDIIFAESDPYGLAARINQIWINPITGELWTADSIETMDGWKKIIPNVTALGNNLLNMIGDLEDSLTNAINGLEARLSDTVITITSPNTAPLRIGQVWLNTVSRRLWIASATANINNWIEVTAESGIPGMGGGLIPFMEASPYDINLIGAKPYTFYFSIPEKDIYVLSQVAPVEFTRFLGEYLAPINPFAFRNFLSSANTIYQGTGEFTGTTENILFDPEEAVYMGQLLEYYDFKGTWMLWKPESEGLFTFTTEYLPGFVAQPVVLSILKGTHYTNFAPEVQHYYDGINVPIVTAGTGEIWAIRAAIPFDYPGQFKVIINEYSP